MPCIFCIAVLAMMGSAIGVAVVDKIQESLAKKSGNPVARSSDTESTAKLETVFNVAGKQVPVAVTVYKQHARARIQILTHDLTASQVKQLQDEIAVAIDGRIVDRSDASGIGILKDTMPQDPSAMVDERLPNPKPPESIPPRS